ncbi:MAG: hypothetical protein ACREMA_18730, partial [Longimicrobiales bacterium]
QSILPESVTPERGLRMKGAMHDFQTAPDPFNGGRRVNTMRGSAGQEMLIYESEDDTVLPEFWLRWGAVLQFAYADQLDPSVVPFEVVAEDVNTAEPVVRFPQGLYVVFSTEGKILDIGPNIHDGLPFYWTRFSKSAGLLGPAPATPLREIQSSINWCQSLREIGIDQRAMPKILAPVEARVKRRAFVSGVVEWIRYRANRFNAKPEFMNPGNMPADLVQFETLLVQVWQDIASTHEVSQAKLPAADISGVAISLLQEQDLASLGYAGEEEEEVFIEVIRRSLINIQKFFPANDPRLAQLAGDAPYLIDAFMSCNIAQGLDLQVIKGSSIPRSPAAVEAKAKESWQLGILLDRYGRPDHRRMQQILG